MEARIIHLQQKKLAGKHLRMSLTYNRTGEVWKSFIPGLRFIPNRVNNDLISMAVYEEGHFEDFKPEREFEKWAAVEVSGFEGLPEDLEPFVLEEGLYAVFDYKGSAADTRIFQYIFGVWLPESGYIADNRPHFEVLGAKYKNADPESEEEIWIPIRKKTSFQATSD